MSNAIALVLCFLGFLALQLVFIGSNMYYTRFFEELNPWKYYFYLAAWMVVSTPWFFMLFRKTADLAQKVWVPSLMYFGSSVIVTAVLGWFLFSEIPEKGTLVGSILVVGGVLLSIFWK